MVVFDHLASGEGQVEGAMHGLAARKDEHATRVAIQAVDNPQPPGGWFEDLGDVRQGNIVPIPNRQQTGWFVDRQQVFVLIEYFKLGFQCGFPILVGSKYHYNYNCRQAFISIIKEQPMHIVLVQVNVKPEHLEAFIAATKENARNSILEAGVVRFDFIQQAEDPTKFVLVEVYKTSDDQLAHRETKHYLTWKVAVTDMMAEPRVGVRYKNILPEDKDWKK